MSLAYKIMHRGREIVYLDYRNKSEEDMVQTLKDAEYLILKDNRPFICLTNISGRLATDLVMNQAIKFVTNTRHLVLKGAIVGVDINNKIVLNGFNRIVDGGLKPYDNEKEAKNYLINNIREF